jgi:hypothetical protein
VHSVNVFENKDGVQSEFFAVAPSVVPLMDYVSERFLFLWTNQDNKTFLWLVGKGKDTYSESARRIASQAMRTWVRAVSSKSEKAYVGRLALNKKQEPNFNGLEKLSGDRLLQLALDKDHLILSADHPIVKEFSSEG